MLQYVTHQDIKGFGLIPELLGRLPVLTYLDPLDFEALRRILVEPKNALVKQYEKLFELEGVKLHITDEALDYIAEVAMASKLGARGLRSICEAIMTDIMFDLPSARDIKYFEVTLELAQEKINRSKIARLKVA
jgi:ATP-dependent Clp protease ATP-binding subunit ClpX